MAVQEKCGCKGARSCILCESANTCTSAPPAIEFTQCSRCGELLKDDEEQARRHVTCASQGILRPSLSLPDGPRFDGVSVVQEFISREQEMALIEFIDKRPWTESQSGRRKQVRGCGFLSLDLQKGGMSGGGGHDLYC